MNEGDVSFILKAAREFSDHLIVTMADEALNEFIGEGAVEVELVPMLLVHVPGTCNFEMSIAKREGVIGLTFQDKPLRILKVKHGEYLTSNAKYQSCIVKGEILGDVWEREAIFSDRFDVHNDEVKRSLLL